MSFAAFSILSLGLWLCMARCACERFVDVYMHDTVVVDIGHMMRS